ncbi:MULTISPECIES: hypothetical protein [unclassified Modestobacter]
MLLVVWIVVAVLAVVVLGSLAYSLFGAMGRLTRELRRLDGEVRPVLAEVQATLDRAAAQRAAGTPDPAPTPR